jgi:threonine dehydratase
MRWVSESMLSSCFLRQVEWLLIESFLLREITLEETIVLPPYIYFEAMEQLESLKCIRFSRAPTFSALGIIAEAEARNARVVFVDPVVNIVELLRIDIQQFAQLVSPRSSWKNRIVVIDGTLASGALPVDIHSWFDGPAAPTILYYESASKYSQMGLDLQMAGILVYPTSLDEIMQRLRPQCTLATLRYFLPLTSLYIKHEWLRSPPTPDTSTTY